MAALRKVQGISLDPETLKEGRARAERLKISFSAYIYHLIRQDLKHEGPLLIEPEKEPNKDK